MQFPELNPEMVCNLTDPLLDIHILFLLLSKLPLLNMKYTFFCGGLNEAFLLLFHVAINNVSDDSFFNENSMQDVYRIGTLLELIRELAFTFVDDGKRVRVCHYSTFLFLLITALASLPVLLSVCLFYH